VFVSHAIQNTVQVPADSLLDNDKDSLEGAEKVKGDKGENLLEFLQYQPDLKASAFATSVSLKKSGITPYILRRFFAWV
jgi:hypothetical protein